MPPGHEEMPGLVDIDAVESLLAVRNRHVEKGNALREAAVRTDLVANHPLRLGVPVGRVIDALRRVEHLDPARGRIGAPAE